MSATTTRTRNSAASPFGGAVDTHMPDAPRRTCDELISNQGTELRAERIEQPCGEDAGAYCTDCAMYVCAQHKNAKHFTHKVARR
jgi:hypothetical protein